MIATQSVREADILGNTEEVINLVEYEISRKTSFRFSDKNYIEIEDNGKKKLYIEYIKANSKLKYIQLANNLKKYMYKTGDAPQHIEIIDVSGEIKGKTDGLPDSFSSKNNYELVDLILNKSAFGFSGLGSITDILSTEDGLAIKAFGFVNKESSRHKNRQQGIITITLPLNTIFTSELKNTTNTEIIIFNKEKFLTGTFFNLEGKMIPFSPEKEIFEKLSSSLEDNEKNFYITDKNINFNTEENPKNINYRLAFSPIKNFSNKTVGMVCVATPTLSLDEAIENFEIRKKDTIFQNIVSLLIVAFIVSVIALTLIYFYSSTISKPIVEITEVVRNVGLGNMNLNSGINSKDEFGELSRGINKMIYNLKIMDRMKDEFLANTSHELKTPLNGIIGITESMIEGTLGNINEMQRKNLGMIVSSSQRLLHLVNDILDSSKLRDNEIKLNKKPINIKETAELTIAISQPLLIGKNVVLTNLIPDNLPFVEADENRVQQIFHNLLGNAIKFTDIGSITINAELKDKFVEISISDTGIGIPKDKFSEIFQEFKQVDSSTERQYGGTGLGLSITKKLVELHGGKIYVESEINKGASFKFLLPVSSVLITQKEEMRNKLSELKSILNSSTNYVNPHLNDTENDFLVLGKDTPTLLIVDDEPINIQVLLNYLSVKNYRLLTATSGIEAIDIINKEDIDLVLLDVMLPKMSGYEVAKYLREKHSLFKLPIIMLTAKDQPENIVLGLESGANDYLPKPFNKKELFARIKTLINLKKSTEQLSNTIEQLTQSQELLIRTEKFAAIGQMAGSLTHELKNPLNAIITNIELLKLDFSEIQNLLPEKSVYEITDEIKICDEAGKQMKKIIMNVLDYSRIENKSNEVVDISSVIDSTCLLVKKELQNNKIELKLNNSPNIFINAKSGEIIQVLLNFILNAKDALVEKISTHKYIQISSFIKDTDLIIEIEDNGMGIKDEDKEKIFEAYYTTKEKGKGTGIGMAVANTILKKYNADILLESKYGTGTKFTIKFLNPSFENHI